MFVYNAVTDNPLRSKKDFQEAVKQLCCPLKKFYSKGGTRLHIGNTGSFCTGRTAGMEAFSRPLWGLVPLLAGGGESELIDIYVRGIKNGTNPNSQEYWGKIGDKDQLMVEMAVLGLALCMIPERVWEPLNESEKHNFSKWLAQINHYIVVDTNWLFFRVLVNLGLKKVKAEYDFEMLERDLDRLDDFYISDGWYQDGISSQRDYYIPFAMQFYGLIYSKLGDDDNRAERYKERAKLFAGDFIYWFSEDGSSIPFGRSLTYRFAQSCFWSALVFAGVDELPLGVMKGIICRNLRWWFQQPIFSTDGILSIGYAYPNLNMAEGYNAPGSPYWALKTFLILALDEEHPFWKADEMELPKLDEKSIQQHPRMIVTRTDEGQHVLAYTSGQHAAFEPVHGAAKYEKFVYSNYFGFSVPRGDFGLEQGAFDSMLALSEGDNIFRVRRKCECYEITGNYVYSKWTPWRDVIIETWLVPVSAWHVRIHKILTERALNASEGAFAIAREKNNKFNPEGIFISEDRAIISYPWGSSGIVNLAGVRKPEIVRAESNTNIIEPRTLIPTLTGELEKGAHILACAVVGSINDIGSLNLLKCPVTIEIGKNSFKIEGLPSDGEIMIDLNH